MTEPTLELGGKSFHPDVRRLFDMKDVIYDQEWLSTAQNMDLYYMYRDLALTKRDRDIINEHSLRYDITVIPPATLGGEFVKTAGHYHPLVPGTDVSYTEVYEVLEGEAHYLLQKASDVCVEDVVLVKATRDDKVIIPPGYGHVTINPSNKVLKMSNWVSSSFSSVYEPIKNRHGAAYFELNDGSFITNSDYDDVPEMRLLEPTNYSDVGLQRNTEMYGLIRSDPELLGYLNQPQEFEWLFEKVLKRE